VSSRSRRARNLIWLTPESLRGAERLSSLTGVPVPELIELVLLELMREEGIEAHPEAAPSAPARSTQRGPAAVIPIGRARSALRWRAPRAVSPAPGPRENLPELRERCELLRARAEGARLASVRARERAGAIREGRYTQV
jgi:hypothetical protein